MWHESILVPKNLWKKLHLSAFSVFIPRCKTALQYDATKWTFEDSGDTACVWRVIPASEDDWGFTHVIVRRRAWTYFRMRPKIIPPNLSTALNKVKCGTHSSRQSVVAVVDANVEFDVPPVQQFMQYSAPPLTIQANQSIILCSCCCCCWRVLPVLVDYR